MLEVVCSNGHSHEYSGLHSVPSALRGYRLPLTGAIVVWRCKDCGAPCGEENGRLSAYASLPEEKV